VPVGLAVSLQKNWGLNNMKTEIIKPEALKDFYLYQVDGRNGCVAIWGKLENKFIVYNYEFGKASIDFDAHIDNGGTVKPLQEIEQYTTPKHGSIIDYLKRWGTLINTIQETIYRQIRENKTL
jgi:hypothetical protein